MPDCQGDSECTSGITRSRLNPDIFKRQFFKKSSIRDAVQGHTAGHAQTLVARHCVSVARHPQHYFFSDYLDAASQIHFALRQLRLRLARWSAKDLVKRTVGHSEAVRVTEVFVIHSNAAVVTNIEQFVFDRTYKCWLTIRRQTHDFVFTTIHFEAGVISERTVQETEAVGITKFFEETYLVTLAYTDGTRGPFTDTVDRKNRSMFEG